MFGQISDFGRYFKKKESFIDNRTFQFHYRVTFGILIASSAIMMMSNLYGGPPIQVCKLIQQPQKCDRERAV